jgi:hypothetical protein
MKRGIILILLVGIVIAISIACSSTDSPRKTSTFDEPSEGDAAFMSQEFVKKNLKAPSTAKFPNPYGRDIDCTKLGNNRFKVVSYVDAENSFGAMIRTNYVAVVKYKGSEHWTLESLEFD